MTNDDNDGITFNPLWRRPGLGSRWSPTADVIVFVVNESRNDELWLVRKGEWPAVQLTKNEWAWDKHPSWSPDGSQIVFMSNHSGSQQLWLMDADGGNQRQLTNFAFEVWDPVWVKYTDQ
jgi:TolB protein